MKVDFRQNKKILPEVRVLLLGPTKSGKTTFLANLLLDKVWSEEKETNIYMLNHKHEIKTGRTSSISYNFYETNDYKFLFLDTPGLTKYKKTREKIINSFDIDIILAFDLKLDVKKIPIIDIDFTKDEFNTSKLINKNMFFDLLTSKIKNNYVPNDKLEFNIIECYSKGNYLYNKIKEKILIGFLKSGCIKINDIKKVYDKKESYNIKIKSIFINGLSHELVNTKDIGPVTLSIQVEHEPDIKEIKGFIGD